MDVSRTYSCSQTCKLYEFDDDFERLHYSRVYFPSSYISLEDSEAIIRKTLIENSREKHAPLDVTLGREKG